MRYDGGRQTDRHTDKLVAVLRFRGGVVEVESSDNGGTECKLS